MAPMTFTRTEFGTTCIGRPDGLWLRIHSAYSYGLVIIGVAVLIAMLIRPFSLYRQQAFGLLTGCLAFTGISVTITAINLPEIVRITLSALDPPLI